jgi:peroxiredoxin
LDFSTALPYDAAYQFPLEVLPLKRNSAAILIVTLVVAVMIYAGVHSSRHPRVSAVAPGAQSLQLGTEAIGKEAPDFTLQDLQGKHVKLSDFRGKAVLLNFWATWCGPCKVEMPWFVELQKQYGPQGLEIVGVALDDSGTETIQKFAKEMGVNYTVLQGRDEVGDAYGAIGLPTSYFIDRNGKVINSSAGLVERGEIEADIKKTLAVAPNAAPQPADSESRSKPAASTS